MFDKNKKILNNLIKFKNPPQRNKKQFIINYDLNNLSLSQKLAKITIFNKFNN